MRKSLRYTASLLLMILCISGAWAQNNIKIHGTTANGEGKTVELYKYSDQLSHNEVYLDEAVIADNGEFTLNAYANYPTLVFLQIEDYSQSFYVEPGRTYEVYLDQFDWNLDEKRNIHLEPEALPLEFVGLPANDINLLVNRFDNLVDSFIVANRAAFDIKYHPSKKYFDTLQMVVEKALPDGDNEFFNRYKLYQLAMLKYTLHFDTRRNMVNKYVKGQPILYYDENYMAMLTSLFANSVSKGNKYIAPHQMVRWVEQNNLSMMLDSLGVDPLLRNEQLREFVALQALQEAYFNCHIYDRESVRSMIQKLEKQTKFGDHRVLAQNILKEYSLTERGSEAKSFILPDVDKDPVNLDDYKGRWIYLSFVRVNDPNSISEIETIAHLKDSVLRDAENVEFITISCDREFQKMYHFLKNTRKGANYQWTWLHFNNDFKMLEHYQVVSYPTFILINPEGKLQYDVTPAPSTGFLFNAPWKNKNEKDNESFFLDR